MGYCVQCGSPIPDYQNTCSMCFGDIDHGSDGYYRKWAEDQERHRIQMELDDLELEAMVRQEELEKQGQIEEWLIREGENEIEQIKKDQEDNEQHDEEDPF